MPRSQLPVQRSQLSLTASFFPPDDVVQLLKKLVVASQISKMAHQSLAPNDIRHILNKIRNRQAERPHRTPRNAKAWTPPPQWQQWISVPRHAGRQAHHGRHVVREVHHGRHAMVTPWTENPKTEGTGGRSSARTGSFLFKDPVITDQVTKELFE